MSFRRRLSWSSALVDIQNDRARHVPGVTIAKTHTVTFARLRKLSLVTATGAYDSSAIMTLAVEAAKAQQARTGQPWATCMSIALKGAWLAARDARARAAH